MPDLTMATPVIRPQAPMPTATEDISLAPWRNSGWRRTEEDRNIRTPAGPPRGRPAPPRGAARTRSAERGGSTSAEDLSRLDVEAAQEVGRAQALAAGPLQFGDQDDGIAGGDGDARRAGRQYRARRVRRRPGLNPRCPELDGFAVEHAARAGKGIEGADAAHDGGGILRPVHLRFVLLDLVRVVHAFGRLRLRLQRSGPGLLQRVDDQPPAERGEPVVQLRRAVLADGERF